MWSSSHTSSQISDYLDYHSLINPTWKDNYFNYSEILEEMESSDMDDYIVCEDFQNRFRVGAKEIVRFYRTMLKKFYLRLDSFSTWSAETRKFQPFQGLSNTRNDLSLAFTDLYQDTDLLLSWAQINMHAFYDALRAYNNITGGDTFEVEYLELEPFSCCKMIRDIQKKIESVFSKEFDDDSKSTLGEEKKQLVKQTYQQLRRRKRRHSKLDVVKFSFVLGMSIPFILLFIYVSFYPSPPVYRYRSFWNTFTIFRSQFLFVFYLYLLGFNIYIWRTFKINHSFLFQFQMRSKIMDHISTVKMASFFLLIWSSTYFLYLGTDKSVIDIFHIPSKYYVLASVIGFILLLLIPVHFFHYTARLTLATTIINLLLTPFGKSRLREHFVADVISSMVIPLQDCMYTFCYFLSGAWKSHTLPNTCDGVIWLGVYGTLISMLPYYWRFCQSVRHAIEHRQYFQLVNAAKYVAAIMLLTINSLYTFLISSDETPLEWGLWRVVVYSSWILILFVTSVGSFLWDVHIDWGLLQIEKVPVAKRKEWYLKLLPLQIRLVGERRRFHIAYYVVSVLYNFVASFAWGMTLSYDLVGNRRDFLKLVFSAMEIIRRANWSVIRLEWAQESNSLRYRKYTFVPTENVLNERVDFV